MRILIVEDQALLALTMDEMLVAAGHFVVGFARDVNEALALAQSRHPELALVDLTLARGASGAVAARLLRDRCGVHSLFVSATPGDCRKLGAEARALGCLSKPFSGDDIADAVAAAHAVIQGVDIARHPPGLELYATA